MPSSMQSTMGLLHALITISLLPLSSHAHMEMSNPFPINSQLNPAVPENLKDYSYTSPLLADGSNYPCKGYQVTSPDQNTTATYMAGQTYTMNITGTATHGGGSCQLSLSYDNGDHFYVIKSMIGGCPITTSYNFTIPSYAQPSKTALFAWSWFNEIGNREMYMNCARVEIQSTSTAPVRRYRRAQYKRQNSTTILNNPPMFVCNVNNGCNTLEQYDVQFPYPGNDVVYGADAAYDGEYYPPHNGSGFLGDPVEPHYNGTFGNYTSLFNGSSYYNGPYYSVSTVTATVTVPYPNATSTTNSSTATVFETTVVTITVTASAGTSTTTPTTTSTSNGPVIKAASPTTSTTSTTSSTTASVVLYTTPASLTITTTSSATTSTTATATLLSGPCTPGTFGCNSINSFSQCVAGAGGTTTYIYMGPVAAGMECVNGQIIQQNDGPCTPNGQLFCDGEYSFYLCDQGGLINMGPVAVGTVCNNGTIESTPSRK